FGRCWGGNGGRGDCLGDVQVGEAKRTAEALAGLEIREGHVVAIRADHRNRHGSTPGGIALLLARNNVPEDSTIGVVSKRGRTYFLEKFDIGEISQMGLVQQDCLRLGTNRPSTVVR